MTEATVQARQVAAARPRAAQTDRATAPPRPSADLRARAAGAATSATGIDRATPVDRAVVSLANDLRSIPGIERFGAIRLGELDRSGPRPLRTLWRIAREQLDDRYSNLTIGEVLDRFGSGSGSPGASA
jgi:hypothetical protein